MDHLKAGRDDSFRNFYDEKPSFFARLLKIIVGIALIGLVGALAIGVLASGDFGLIRGKLIEFGVLSPSHDFSKLYATLGGKLPYAAENNAKVYSALLTLEQQPCDRQAIFEAQSGAWQAGQRKWAADADYNFGLRCPAGSGFELNLAADHYLDIGESQKAYDIIVPVTEKQASSDLYWFTRARTEAALGYHAKAIASYKNVISLTYDKSNIGNWVFAGLSDAYRMTGVPCTIQMLKDSVDNIDANACNRAPTAPSAPASSSTGDKEADDLAKTLNGDR